jgi:UBX domain-containing protein 6
MLRTKAMREKEESRERKKYRFALIRVRFPDGLVLQV